MKKIKGLLFVGIAVLMLCTASVNAQIRFGVKGGLNIASVKFDKDILKTENLTGFHIGPTIEVMVPYVGVGFDAAILYSQKGLYSSTDMRGVSTDYIDVPVNFKWKIGLPIVKGYLSAGPYASIRVSGEDLDRIQTQIKSKSFAAGLNFGAGVEVFNSLQVGFNYGLGLTDDYSASRLGDLTNGKSNTMSVTAALLF
ncbi:MAG: PorT family protein [Tannerellaceae bacterium]|nr:PorT family protein [Tannerellaceae bacterium]